MATLHHPVQAGAYIITTRHHHDSQPLFLTCNARFTAGTPVTTDVPLTTWYISFSSSDNGAYWIQPDNQTTYVAPQDDQGTDSEQSKRKVYLESNPQEYSFENTDTGFYKIRLAGDGDSEYYLKYQGQGEQVTASKADASTSLEWDLTLVQEDPSRKFSYEAYPGFFEQDDEHETKRRHDFGLKSDTWVKFWREIDALNKEGDGKKIFKVIFLGRHGEGINNIQLPKDDGDGDLTVDASLTQHGYLQDIHTKSIWIKELVYGLGLPQISYCSPLTRTMATNTITFSDQLWGNHPKMDTLLLESCRERVEPGGESARRTKTYITTVFPKFSADELSDKDQLWNGTYKETFYDVECRALSVLDKLFSETGTFASITTHSGFVSAFTSVIGRGKYKIHEGAVLPLVCKCTVNQAE